MKGSIEEILKKIEATSKEDLNDIYKNRPIPPLRAESSMDFWYPKIKDLDVRNHARYKYLLMKNP